MDLTMAEGNAANKKPHVVVFPYPAQGHINPMFLFSEILASRGCIITFVNTEVTQSLVEQSLGRYPMDSSLEIHLVTIPDPLPPGSTQLVGTARELERILASEKNLLEAFTDLIGKLMLEETPPVCIVSDFALSWCNDVADKFGLCKANFWTASLASCASYAHAPLLLSRGYIPITRNDPKDLISCISGIPPILRADDLPSMLLFSQTLDFVIRRLDPIRKAHWILANSFSELETFPIGFEVPILAIGPLVPDALLVNNSSPLKRRAKISLLPEDEDCKNWLDTQRKESVLYISFGSSGILNSEQVEELAIGLQASKQAFLWAFRSDALEGTRCDLPEGFQESTRQQGRVVRWAPQFEVLSHGSVGGFLTHCGWNSVMESIYTGVPMLAWPYVAEQRMNARFLVEEWKVAMELEREEGEVVRRGEVERKVRALMEGREGREMREEIEKWKGRARRAAATATAGEGGTVEPFVEELKSLV